MWQIGVHDHGDGLRGELWSFDAETEMDFYFLANKKPSKAAQTQIESSSEAKRRNYGVWWAQNDTTILHYRTGVFSDYPHVGRLFGSR